MKCISGVSKAPRAFEFESLMTRKYFDHSTTRYDCMHMHVLYGTYNAASQPFDDDKGKKSDIYTDKNRKDRSKHTNAIAMIELVDTLRWITSIKI